MEYLFYIFLLENKILDKYVYYNHYSLLLLHLILYNYYTLNSHLYCI